MWKRASQLKKPHVGTTHGGRVPEPKVVSKKGIHPSKQAMAPMSPGDDLTGEPPDTEGMSAVDPAANVTAQTNMDGKTDPDPQDQPIVPSATPLSRKAKRWPYSPQESN